MTMTWFTADPHFGHARIIEYCKRPFGSVEEMNEKLVDNWNGRVRPEDTVYILGDLALGKVADSLEYVKLLQGNKILIPGNHDKVWVGATKPGRPVNQDHIDMYEAAGLTIADGIVPYLSYSWSPDMQDMDHTTEPQRWTLCHFPDVGDSHDGDRFTDFRPQRPSKPDILIHGHVHEKWLTNRYRINVGVDVWGFRPAAEHEIRRLYREAWS